MELSDLKKRISQYDYINQYRLWIHQLNQNEVVILSRWGDGEFKCLYQLEKENKYNCDGHKYYKDLGDRLKKILKSHPPYTNGLSAFGSLKKVKDKKGIYILDRVLTDYPNINWILGCVFRKVSLDIGLSDFFSILNKKSVVLVGPKHMKVLNKRFSFNHIIIPEKNCWIEYDNVLKKCMNQNANIYIFCASMMANVLIDDLYQLKKNVSLIHIGSTFDPYVGKCTRSNHSDMIRIIKERGF